VLRTWLTPGPPAKRTWSLVCRLCRRELGLSDEAALVTHPDDPHVPILLGTNIETTEFKEVALRALRATEDHAARMKAHGAEP